MPNLQSMSDALGLWNNAQRPMTKICRWSNFPEYGQTLVEHSNSLPIVADWIMSQLPEGFILRPELVLRACTLHDHGEPLLGEDVLFDNKSSTRDLKEWEAFYSLTSKQHQADLFRRNLHEAFLLQFCLDKDFKPGDAYTKKIIKDLESLCEHEALAFECSEYMDYLFSAYAGHKRGIKNAEECMLEHTMDRVPRLLDELVSKCDIFGHIWTPQLKGELTELSS